MNAAELMLIISRTVQETIDSVATGGSVTTVTDTLIKRKAETFDGGCLWITRGTPATTVVKDVTSSQTDTFTFTPAEATTIAAGNVYSISVNKFNKRDLLQAVNMALISQLQPMYDTSLTTVLGQEDYTLPAGVADVRTVEIAQESAAPYGYQKNRNWREVNGTLTFVGGSLSAGKKIRLLYPGTPAQLAVTDTVPYSINVDRLKWSAIEHLWRRVILVAEQDHPINQELLNEAKANYEIAKRQAKAPYIPPKDFMMGWA